MGSNASIRLTSGEAEQGDAANPSEKQASPAGNSRRLQREHLLVFVSLPTSSIHQDRGLVHSAGFFHRTDSYYKISEYLVLNVSNVPLNQVFVMPSLSPPPPPRSSQVTTSSASAALGPAVYRKAKRAPLRRPADTRNWSEVDFESVFKKSCRDEFLRLAREAQEGITDVIFELATLSYKAFLSLAAGDFYRNWGQDPTAVSLFDITTAFPVGSRSARLLSPNPVQDTGLAAAGKHPLWRATADALMTTGTTTITSAPARMSSTITEHIREYATGVNVREMPNTPVRARRMQAVYKAIDNLQAHEPQTAHTTLPELQRQLAQLTAGDDASSTAMTSVVMTDGASSQQEAEPAAEYDDLEGEDEDEDEEDVDVDGNDGDNDGQDGGGQGPAKAQAVAQAKETCARKIKALVAISKKLVQEPVTAQSPPIDVAGRRVDPQTNRSKTSLPHIGLRAPFVLIANCSKFTRRMMPQIAPSSLHAIALGGTGMYEVFCAETPGHFDVRGADRMALRSLKNVTLVPGNKAAMFEQIAFVDRYTLNLTGRVIAHDNNGRVGYPVESEIEKRKKAKKCEFRLTAERGKRDQERDAKDLHATAKTSQAAQSAARLNVNKNMRPKANYDILVQARTVQRMHGEELLSKETALRQIRKEAYYWNKVIEASRTAQANVGAGDGNGDGNGDGAGAGGAQEKLDLTQLQNITTNTRGKRRLLVFAGTDYGIAKMSETVAMTQAQIQTHINRYHQLHDSPAAQPPAALPPSPAVGLQAPPCTGANAHATATTTAVESGETSTIPQNNGTDDQRRVAHLEDCQETRKWFEGNETVKAALEELTKPENVFQGACFIQYTIKSRDTHAAVGIAIAEASSHLEPNRVVLAPYTRGFQPNTTTTNNASPAAGSTPLLTSAASSGLSDATGAPMSTMGLSSSPGGDYNRLPMQ
ncbi:hypothetical protein KVV02_003395 [Mortierella alpina]|uniref:Uncharacterized protein n=1 Tax=Mortierella alpina TaxID=64518 RepID=A0A9P7ZW73_MORAP|nr:hypothetical protein KVV02_003395 [Mortierella alpina]